MILPLMPHHQVLRTIRRIFFFENASINCTWTFDVCARQLVKGWAILRIHCVSHISCGTVWFTHTHTLEKLFSSKLTGFEAGPWCGQWAFCSSSFPQSCRNIRLGPYCVSCQTKNKMMERNRDTQLQMLTHLNPKVWEGTWPS